MPALELVEAPALDAAGQMGLDEAVLTLHSGLLARLRFYRWQRSAVTFGYSQAFALARELARSRGLAGAELVRRATGGGVVFHDGDLTFSVVFAWERLSAPSLVYKDIHRGVHLGLKQAGVFTRVWSRAKPSAAPVSPQAACFGGPPEPMDLVREDGVKVLGGALRRRGGKGLYQGSLRVDALAAPLSTVRRAIAEGLGRKFRLAPERGLAADWLSHGRRLSEKYRSARWNRRR
ncbi:MAG: hypothetical protein KGO96_01750 [Elusimicrobia bacterium]|nr:hypothetical protein [Elusimicrobiota bacterium]MDE2236643.1 hypothetical protein [Elusimicrobiota bacterium]MDE2424619.1 hypothetical protein [Elusimicrobiota bacterium]